MGRAWTSDTRFTGHRTRFYNTWTRFRRHHAWQSEQIYRLSTVNEEWSIKWLKLLWILIQISNDYCIFLKDSGKFKSVLDLETLTLSPDFPVPQRKKTFFLLEVTPSKLTFNNIYSYVHSLRKLCCVFFRCGKCYTPNWHESLSLSLPGK